MKHKKLTALLAVLVVSTLGVGALSYYSGTAEKKQNDFNIVAGQKDQDGAGTIQEPAQENGGKADAAAGLQPDQIVPKDPYIVSNVDWSAWAIMKVEVPKFTEDPNTGKPAAELLNVNANGKQKLLRELDDAEKHTVVYGYTEPLAGNNSTKPEADRARTSSLFDSFKITGDISLANTYTGVIRVSGTLLQTEGHATVDDAAEGSGITPKSYAITYDLGENAVLSGQKTRYSSDDYGYTPPTPTREGYEFAGWTPASIADGSTNTVNFTAAQSRTYNTVFDESKMQNKINTSINSFLHAETKPDNNVLTADNIVSTINSDTPIYMQNDGNSVKWYSEDPHPKFPQSISYLFEGCKQLIDISGLRDIDTSNVTSMSGVFDGCKSLQDTSQLINQNTNNVIEIDYMFNDCTNLQDITGLRNQNVANVQDMSSAFSNCSSLRDTTPLKNQNTQKLQDMEDTFSGCSSLTNLDGLSNQTQVQHPTMYNLFYGCSSLEDLTPLKNWNMSSVDDMRELFHNCTNISDLTPLANQDMSQADIIFSMFEGCTSISDLSPLANWDISNVSDMDDLFRDCTGITDLTPISHQNFGNTSMDGMFICCTGITSIVPLSNQNTGMVRSMSALFGGCSNLTDASAINEQDISSVRIGLFHNSQTESSAGFYQMFNDCPSHPEFTKRAGTQTSDGTFVPSD